MEIIGKFIIRTEHRPVDSNSVSVCNWRQGIEYDFFLETTCDRKDDKKNGRYTGYLFNAKSFEYMYQNNMHHGTYVGYYSDGTIRRRGGCANNLPCGDWTMYDQQGNLIEYMRYLNGEKYGYKLYVINHVPCKKYYWRDCEVDEERFAQLKAGKY